MRRVHTDGMTLNSRGGGLATDNFGPVIRDDYRSGETSRPTGELEA
jgi:hypothetical protein